MAADRKTDSPIFLLLPDLPEADPASSAFALPLTFREDVKRADAAHSRGWLRLLSREVRGLPFEGEGLRLIARAQWGLADFDGALESWETVRDKAPGDVEASLALANIYERLYRKKRRESRGAGPQADPGAPSRTAPPKPRNRSLRIGFTGCRHLVSRGVRRIGYQEHRVSPVLAERVLEGSVWWLGGLAKSIHQTL